MAEYIGWFGIWQIETGIVYSSIEISPLIRKHVMLQFLY